MRIVSMQRLFAGMTFSAVALLCCAGCHDGATSLPDGQASDVGRALPDGQSNVDGAPASDTPGDRPVAELGGVDIQTEVREPLPDASGDAGSCYGTCLESVFAQCPTTAGQTCTSTTSESGFQTTECYSNGVKLLQIKNGSGFEVTVKKANGDPCFQAESPSPASETVSDPEGNMVAYIQFLSGTQLSIACQDGSVTNVDLTSAACTAKTNPTCSTGACTW
jgi:hypothetical protein